MTDPFWTTELVEELKNRWANWETFTEIARALHNSRNAIIGKAHRLGLRREPLERRLSRNQQKPRRRRVRMGTNGHQHSTKGGTVTKDETPPGFGNPKRFIELRECECHWPGPGLVGPDLLCCAAPVIDGKPYCLAHCRIAYNPPSRPRL